MNLFECLVAERLRQIDATDLGADDRRQFVDGDRVVGRRFIRTVLVTRSIVATQDAHAFSPSAGGSVGSLAGTAMLRHVGIELRGFTPIRHAIVADHTYPTV